MKLLVDMNLSPRWVDVLLQAGHEAIHWSAVGDPQATDAEIMSTAVELHAVVLTNDLDFGTMLAASGAEGPSVIQLRSTDLRPQAVAGLVTAALAQLATELDSGALVTIQAGSARLRVLPLTPQRSTPM